MADVWGDRNPRTPACGNARGHRAQVVLEKLWQTYGQLLLLSRPEHFSNLAAAPDTFANARCEEGTA